jgi:hypothetical protein
MSLKARSLIVRAMQRWELTHDGDDAQMKDYIDRAMAEIFAEKLETILDVVGE